MNHFIINSRKLIVFIYEFFYFFQFVFSPAALYNTCNKHKNNSVAQADDLIIF